MVKDDSEREVSSITPFGIATVCFQFLVLISTLILLYTLFPKHRKRLAIVQYTTLFTVIFSAIYVVLATVQSIIIFASQGEEYHNTNNLILFGLRSSAFFIGLGLLDYTTLLRYERITLAIPGSKTFKKIRIAKIFTIVYTVISLIIGVLGNILTGTAPKSIYIPIVKLKMGLDVGCIFWCLFLECFLQWRMIKSILTTKGHLITNKVKSKKTKTLRRNLYGMYWTLLFVDFVAILVYFLFSQLLFKDYELELTNISTTMLSVHVIVCILLLKKLQSGVSQLRNHQETTNNLGSITTTTTGDESSTVTSIMKKKDGGGDIESDINYDISTNNSI